MDTTVRIKSINSLTFYKDWLKCLNTKSVKCRSTVKHNRMFFNYILKYIPNIIFKMFYALLSLLDIFCKTSPYKFSHNKWLEKLDCHFLWKTTLVNLEFRSYYDN